MIAPESSVVEISGRPKGAGGGGLFGGAESGGDRIVSSGTKGEGEADRAFGGAARGSGRGGIVGLGSGGEEEADPRGGRLLPAVALRLEFLALVPEFLPNLGRWFASSAQYHPLGP